MFQSSGLLALSTLVTIVYAQAAANVGLFNLTGITPPSTAVLKAVYLGYGTAQDSCLI
jgi:hypothetical protein